MYQKTKKARLRQLKEILEGQKYLTIGFHPAIAPNLPGYRFQWTFQFKRNSFENFEKMTSDFNEIKNWIIKNGVKMN